MKNEVLIMDFFSKYDQIRSLLQIWLHLLKKPWMENFIFYVVPQFSFVEEIQRRS